MLPLLKRNAPGLIINIGSLGAEGIPFASVYSGSKAFNMSFSEGLRQEMACSNTDIEVLGVVVAEAQSAANKSAPNLFILTSRAMAQAALDRVGCGVGVLYAAVPHAIEGWVVANLPHVVKDKIVRIAAKDRFEKEIRWAKGQ
jgi:short-subunit dehydrogenase